MTLLAGQQERLVNNLAPTIAKGSSLDDYGGPGLTRIDLMKNKPKVVTVVLAVVTRCAGGRHNMPLPCKLTFDLLTLKVVSESRVSGLPLCQF